MAKQKPGGKAANTLPEVEFARRDGSAFGVEVIALEELHQREMDHSIFRPHRIDFHILLLVTRGRGWHMVDFERHRVAPGTMAHTAPGQVQSYDRENKLAGYLVLFQPEVCGLEAPKLRWPPAFRTAPADFQLLESLARLMFDLKTSDTSASPDRVAWQMLPALLEVCEGAVSQYIARHTPIHSVEFEAFDALVNENFARHRALSWYARMLGHSEKTLYRWCQRVVGRSAKAHIDRRVTLEAKRLLVHTELAIESIAGRLGFSEATNFVKFFKRVERVTPTGFRDSYT